MPGLTVFANPRRRVAATLTNRLEEIRYKHREDGKWYKHKFAPGASVKLLRDGKAVIERKDGKPVWMDDSTLDSGADDMHFFINPKHARRKVKSSQRRRRTTKTRHPVARHRPKKRSTDMARKRARKRVRHQRRRSAVARRRHHANPRRRRRPVAVTHYAANAPKRRRRRHAVARTHRRRRSYRRNPSFGVNFLLEGLKDGAGVVVGQVGTRKLGGLAQKYVPGLSATTGIMAVAPTLVGAIATAFVARKALPRYSRIITAGAFAEAINQGLAQTPVASYLNAWPAGGARVGTVSAWPANRPALTAGQPQPGMRAYPSRRVGVVREVG